MEKQFKVEIPRKNRPELEFYTDLEEREIIQNYMDNYDWVTDTSEKFSNPKVCCICGLTRNTTVEGKHYCSRHKGHLRRHGRLLSHTSRTPNELRINKDHAVIVTRSRDGNDITGEFTIDLESVIKALEYKWHAKSDPHGVYCLNRNEDSKGIKETIRLHRHLLGATKTDPFVDHADRDTTNNRLSNLRYATDLENGCNMTMYSDSISGIIGVTPLESGRWKVLLHHDHQIFRLGSFTELEKAISVRLQAEADILPIGFAPQRHLFEKNGIVRNENITLDDYKVEKEVTNKYGVEGISYNEERGKYSISMKRKGYKTFRKRESDLELAKAMRLYLEYKYFGDKAPQYALFPKYNIEDRVEELELKCFPPSKQLVKGVAKNARGSKYTAQLTVNKVSLFSEQLPTLHEAQVARLQAEVDNLPIGHKSRQEHLYEKFGIISK